MKISGDNELLLKFMAVNLSSGIAIGMMNLIIPIFALSLNASSAEIGMIRGISSVGDLLIVLPAGVLVDYFGMRKLYVASCIIGGVTILAFSLAGSVMGLMLLMVVYGMTRTVRTTALISSFYKYIGRIGTRKIGWYRGSMGVGSYFIGPFLGGLLAAWISFTSFFMATTAFLVAPLIMFAATMYHRKGLARTPITRNRAGMGDSWRYYARLLNNKDLVIMTMTDSVCVSFYMTFMTFITVLVIRDMGESALLAALLITLRGGTNMLVVFFCSGLLQRDNHKLFVVNMLGTIMGLIMLGVARDIAMLAIASLITGVCTGVLSLITLTRVGNIGGERGKIAGFNSFGVSAGNIAGPVLGGVIADIFGIPAIFLFFAVFFIALTAYAMLDHHKTTAVSTATP